MNDHYDGTVGTATEMGGGTIFKLHSNTKPAAPLSLSAEPADKPSLDDRLAAMGAFVPGKAPPTGAQAAARDARNFAGLQQELAEQKRNEFWRQQADLGNLYEPPMSAEREAAIRRQFNLPPKENH